MAWPDPHPKLGRAELGLFGATKSFLEGILVGGIYRKLALLPAFPLSRGRAGLGFKVVHNSDWYQLFQEAISRALWFVGLPRVELASKRVGAVFYPSHKDSWPPRRNKERL